MDSAPPATIQTATKGEGKPEQQQKCVAVTPSLKHHPMVPALHAAPPRGDWDSILHSHPLLYLATAAQDLQQSDISINPFIPGSYVQGLQKMSGLRAELPGRQQLQSSQGGTFMCWQSAEAMEGIPGGTRLLPGCVEPQEPLWLPGSSGTMV